MKIRFLKSFFNIPIGTVQINLEMDDNYEITIRELIEYGIVEVVEEKEYTGSEMIRFAQYFDSLTDGREPINDDRVRNILVHGNWRSE